MPVWSVKTFPCPQHSCFLTPSSGLPLAQLPLSKPGPPPQQTPLHTLFQLSQPQISTIKPQKPIENHSIRTVFYRSQNPRTFAIIRL